MDLQLKPDCKNYKPTKRRCEPILIDDNSTVKASIKTEPIDYSTVAGTDSKQVKNNNSIDNSTEEESDADFVKPYIINIRYKKSLQDVTCDNKIIKRKKSSQASELSQGCNMDLDIEDQLSTLTDLSVTTNCHNTCDVVCPGEVYQCNECKFKTSQKHVLRKHIKTHSSEKPYRCSKCNYRSVTMRSLQKHLITHMPEKPYKCPKCSYSGSRKLYLDVHMRTHVVNSSYKCSACEYTASQRSTLTKHFNVEHLFLPG